MSHNQFGCLTSHLYWDIWRTRCENTPPIFNSCLCFSSLTATKTMMDTLTRMRRFPMGGWISSMAVALRISTATCTWRVSVFLKSLPNHMLQYSRVCVHFPQWCNVSDVIYANKPQPTASGGLMIPWRRRWCVLKDETFMWFRAKQDSLKSGWLYKKGGGMSTLSRRNWKMRWFILRGTKLMYFENDSEEKLKGTIDISGVKYDQLSAVSATEPVFLVCFTEFWFPLCLQRNSGQSWERKRTEYCDRGENVPHLRRVSRRRQVWCILCQIAEWSTFRTSFSSTLLSCVSHVWERSSPLWLPREIHRVICHFWLHVG